MITEQRVRELIHEELGQELMDSEQAARYLGVHRQTLWNWRSKGTGPKTLKFGTVLRYRRSDLDNFVEGGA